MEQSDRSDRQERQGQGEPTPARRNYRPDLRIGTSGWHYASWWGPFYPKEVKKKDALNYYVTQYAAAELNAPFYRTPTEKAVENWRDSVPENFRFAWKASKFITHWRRLIVNENSMNLLEDRVTRLGDKLGPILFQLPPQMAANEERLATFLEALPKHHRYSFEFRHKSWYRKPILDLLSRHNASLCLSDHVDAPAPREVTADWVYARLHGANGRYHGNYSPQALGNWAKSMREWRAEGRDIWCFFDNDVEAAAPVDAKRLMEMLES
jgi:uncharacterized protein YecE (DUF72 family)